MVQASPDSVSLDTSWIALGFKMDYKLIVTHDNTLKSQ